MTYRPRISIAALIYRSTRFADSVYASLQEFTPWLQDPEARTRFFFVLNDPEKGLLGHIMQKGYPWVMHHVPKPWLTEDELFAQGYGTPEYISRVYRAWNHAIMHGDEICVLVNSDHIFSPNWLENLIRPLLENPRQLVCSQAIELPGFNGAWPVDFGRKLDTFRKDEFLEFVEANKQPGVVRPSGVYMPVAFYRHFAIGAGLYPEGNLHGGRYDKIAKFGDAAFFERMEEKYNIQHVTAMDSIVYHFREAERLE
jgi:glycosyltransferase involved in cell wall biosynthesis